MIVVPVQLGCCPDTPRCVLCPPPPEPPTPELIEALIEHYDRPGDEVEVRFFGGAPPTDAQLAAAAGRRILVRVRPDLLARADADRLVAAGVHAVELDALTFDDRVLAAAGRRYKGRRVEEMSAALAERGLRVGGVLAPGLPGSTFAGAVADARRAAPLWSFARLHPVLVLDGSALRELHEAQRYEPLALGEAVTACRAMLDVLEAAGVEVIRVGLQPGPDGFGRAVAGPRHTSLRELVEARRALDRLREALADVPRGSTVTVACAPADETRTRGPYNQNVRTLRAELGLAGLRIIADPSLPRGAHRVQVHQETP